MSTFIKETIDWLTDWVVPFLSIQLFLKRTFGTNGVGYLQIKCRSSHPTDSVKSLSLKGTKTTHHKTENQPLALSFLTPWSNRLFKSLHDGSGMPVLHIISQCFTNAYIISYYYILHTVLFLCYHNNCKQGRHQTLPTLCNPTTTFAADRPHRLAQKFSEYYLFVHAWHIEWSLLLHDVTGYWMIPFAANATVTTAAKVANAFEWPGQPLKLPLPLEDLTLM